MRFIQGVFFFVLAICVCFVAACGSSGGNESYQKEIHVRGIFDRSGSTAEVGLPYSQAILDFIEDVNAKGGIREHKIVFEWEDIKNDPQRALQAYDKWKEDQNWSKVITIFGWKTEDSRLMTQKVEGDLIPYLSASYAASLSSPRDIKQEILLPPDDTPRSIETKAAPYSFFGGTDTSTSLRLGLQFVKNTGAERIGFLFCENQDCTEPLPAGKTYAAELGLSFAPDLQIPLDSDAASIDQTIRSYLQANPLKEGEKTWFWIGHTTRAASLISRALGKHAPQAQILVNVWGFDETFYERCKEENGNNPCQGRVFGLMPFAPFGELGYQGMKDVVVQQTEYRRKKGEELQLHRNVRYVQGYVSAMIWKAAVEQLFEQGLEITGYSLKREFERFRNFSTQGLTFPISFTSTDHRPSRGTLIYTFDANGGLKYTTEVEFKELPVEWSMWLGW
jgi:branched-chain amino acid transport system substrate-binding protein